MYYFHYQNVRSVYVYGLDCVNFLQGQLSNDLRRLNFSRELQLNSLCNQKGRVIGLFFTYYISENSLILSLPKNHVNFILLALKKYAIFSKITFKITDKYHLIYLNTERVFSKFSSLNHHKIVNQVLLENIKSNYDNFSYLQVQQQNIYQQFPWIDAENTGKFLPLELNLDQFQVVSYNKGCFMGQEIITRMKYRGKSKKRLLSVALDFDLPKMDYLYNNEQNIIAKVINQVVLDKKTYFLAIFNHVMNDINIILAGNLKVSIIH